MFSSGFATHELLASAWKIFGSIDSSGLHGYKIDRKKYGLDHSVLFFRQEDNSWLAVVLANKNDKQNDRNQYLGIKFYQDAKTAKLAETETLKQFVIKKTIILEKAEEKESVPDEAHFLRKMHQLQGFFKAPYKCFTKTYFLMDYFTGKSANEIKWDKYSYEEKTCIALNLMGQLCELQRNGVCHNDLGIQGMVSPNILIDDADLSVHIFDFNLSKFLDKKNQENDIKQIYHIIHNTMGVSADYFSEPYGMLLLFCHRLEQQGSMLPALDRYKTEATQHIDWSRILADKTIIESCAEKTEADKAWLNNFEILESLLPSMPQSTKPLSLMR